MFMAFGTSLSCSARRLLPKQARLLSCDECVSAASRSRRGGGSPWARRGNPPLAPRARPPERERDGDGDGDGTAKDGEVSSDVLEVRAGAREALQATVNAVELRRNKSRIPTSEEDIPVFLEVAQLGANQKLANSAIGVGNTLRGRDMDYAMTRRSVDNVGAVALADNDQKRRNSPTVVLGPSLPPDVEGAVRGELRLTASELTWKLQGAPQKTLASIRWWGERGSGVKVPLDSASCTAIFPLCSGPKFVVRYLRDAQTVVLHFHAVSAEGTSSIRGTAEMELTHIGAHKPTVSKLDVSTPNGKRLGQITVSVVLAFNETISSFELAEHLSVVDPKLPLHPPNETCLPQGAPPPRAAARLVAKRATLSPFAVAEASVTEQETEEAEPVMECARDLNEQYYTNAADALVQFELFFTVLRKLHHSNQIRLLESFRECDRNCDGRLQPNEVRRLIKKLLPIEMTLGDVQFDLLLLVLDINFDSEISYAEISSALRNCKGILTSKGMEKAQSAVRKISMHLLDQMNLAPMPSGNSVSLPLRAWKSHIRRIIPWITTSDMQQFSVQLIHWISTQRALAESALLRGEGLSKVELERFLRESCEEKYFERSNMKHIDHARFSDRTKSICTSSFAPPLPDPSSDGQGGSDQAIRIHQSNPSNASMSYSMQTIGGKLEQLIERTRQLRDRMDIANDGETENAYRSNDEYGCDWRNMDGALEQSSDTELSSDNDMRHNLPVIRDGIEYNESDERYLRPIPHLLGAASMHDASNAAYVGMGDVIDMDYTADALCEDTEAFVSDAAGGDDDLLDALFFAGAGTEAKEVKHVDLDHSESLNTTSCTIRCEISAIDWGDDVKSRFLNGDDGTICICMRVPGFSDTANAHVNVQDFVHNLNDLPGRSLCTLEITLPNDERLIPKLCAVEVRYNSSGESDSASSADIDCLIGISTVTISREQNFAFARADIRNPLKIASAGAMSVRAVAIPVCHIDSPPRDIEARGIECDRETNTPEAQKCREEVERFVDVHLRHITDLPIPSNRMSGIETQFCVLYKFPGESHPFQSSYKVPSNGGCAFNAHARHILRGQAVLSDENQSTEHDTCEDIVNLIRQSSTTNGCAAEPELVFELMACAGKDVNTSADTAPICVATTHLPLSKILKRLGTTRSSKGVGMYDSFDLDLNDACIADGWSTFEGRCPKLHLAVAFSSSSAISGPENDTHGTEMTDDVPDDDETVEHLNSYEEESIAIVISMEITEASGMRDICESIGTTLDENTCRLGPNSYVTVSIQNLPTDDELCDVLLARTPLVARNYLPDYNYSKDVEVTLQTAELRDFYQLAELEVIIWHRSFLTDKRSNLNGRRKMHGSSHIGKECIQHCEDIAIAQVRVAMRMILDCEYGYRGWISLRRAQLDAATKNGAYDSTGALNVRFRIENHEDIRRAFQRTCGRDQCMGMLLSQMQPVPMSFSRIRASVFAKTVLLPRGMQRFKSQNREAIGDWPSGASQESPVVCGLAIRFPGIETIAYTRTRSAVSSEAHRGRLVLKLDDCRTFHLKDPMIHTVQALREMFDQNPLILEVIRYNDEATAIDLSQDNECAAPNTHDAGISIGYGELDLLPLLSRTASSEKLEQPQKRWLATSVVLLNANPNMRERQSGAFIKVKVLLELWSNEQGPIESSFDPT